ncbi:hypothetical protein, partial [Streptococcus sp.]|uniref:hypothetical protein n=1 Tax=Streptococcus sp. TaxID=1306 RepID=UPI0025F91E29
SRELVFRQLQRKNLYFLQLYLTGIFTSADESQNIPHNACRIRNDPRQNADFITNITSITDMFKNSKKTGVMI